MNKETAKKLWVIKHRKFIDVSYFIMQVIIGTFAIVGAIAIVLFFMAIS